MGIDPPHHEPNAGKKHPGYAAYLYMVRGLAIKRANHVWAIVDISTMVAQGFVSLCAVVDWASRQVLAHRVSIAPDTDICIRAVEEWITRHGRPEIFNTDQGGQLTSRAFTDVQAGRGTRFSMDSKGAWRDNVLVERL